MGSSRALSAASALLCSCVFLAQTQVVLARCVDTQAPQINSVSTFVRGVQVNAATGAQTAQDPADAETGSAKIKITGVIEQLDSCTLNGVANSFSPPTKAILLIKLKNGVVTNTETIDTFVQDGATGKFNFEFDTRTSYLNGKTQEYTYTVEAMNDFGSKTVEKNPADNNAASTPLAFKFDTFAGADAAVAALVAVSIGCPVASATTMQATTFAPEVNIPGPLAITCCSDDCVLSGEGGATEVTLAANAFQNTAKKLTLSKLPKVTMTQPLTGHIFLAASKAFFNAITWVNVEIEGDAASTIQFDGDQTFGGKSTVFTGSSTVSTNGKKVDITAGNKLFILENVIWEATSGVTKIFGGSLLVVGTNSPTASRNPGLVFKGSAKCEVDGDGKITHIGGDIVFDGQANNAINDVSSACPVTLVKKTEATDVVSHPTAQFTSNPNLYCCFATCGGVLSINQGSQMTLGRRDDKLNTPADSCKGLEAGKNIGKADTINIAPDNKGGSVHFMNIDTTTSAFLVTNPVTNTANGAIVATLGPTIPTTPANIKLFDQPLQGAATIPQFTPSAPAHRTSAFSLVNGFYSILLGATILPTPTQSNGVVAPNDPPSAPVTTATVSSSDDTSDKGLYGLFGLILIPLLCSLAICYLMKAKTDKADAQYAQDTAAFANVATAPTQGAGQTYAAQGTYAGQGGYAMA